MIDVRVLEGDEIDAHVSDVAALRIAVFRDWPYLYDGELVHERQYVATKAAAGEHDENIDFATTEKIIGTARAHEMRDTAIRLYREAADYALTKGIIIADTKFEFGLDANSVLHLIDEVLTPDSSRFWPLDSYRTGVSPESFDKQFIRNWLDSIGFDRKPPAPVVPPDIAQKTSDKYREALTRLTA